MFLKAQSLHLHTFKILNSILVHPLNSTSQVSGFILYIYPILLLSTFYFPGPVLGSIKFLLSGNLCFNWKDKINLKLNQSEARMSAVEKNAGNRQYIT